MPRAADKPMQLVASSWLASRKLGSATKTYFVSSSGGGGVYVTSGHSLYLAVTVPTQCTHRPPSIRPPGQRCSQYSRYTSPPAAPAPVRPRPIRAQHAQHSANHSPARSTAGQSGTTAGGAYLPCWLPIGIPRIRHDTKSMQYNT